jgi:hypothetical protein
MGLPQGVTFMPRRPSGFIRKRVMNHMTPHLADGSFAAPGSYDGLIMPFDFTHARNIQIIHHREHHPPAMEKAEFVIRYPVPQYVSAHHITSAHKIPGAGIIRPAKRGHQFRGHDLIRVNKENPVIFDIQVVQTPLTFFWVASVPRKHLDTRAALLGDQPGSIRAE